MKSAPLALVLFGLLAVQAAPRPGILSNIAKGSQAVASEGIAKVSGGVTGAVGKILDTNAAISHLVLDKVNKIVNDVMSVFEYAGKKINTIEDNILDGHDKAAIKLIKSAKNMEAQILETIAAAGGNVEDAKQKLSDTAREGVSMVIDNLQAQTQDALDVLNKLKNSLSASQEQISSQMKGGVQKLIASINNKVKTGGNIVEINKQIVDEIKNGVDKVVGDVSTQLQGVIDQVNTLGETILAKQVESAQKLAGSAKSLMDNLVDSFAEVKDNVGGVKDKLSQLVEEKASSLVDVLQKNAESTANWLQTIVDSINSTVNDVMSSVKNNVSLMVKDTLKNIQIATGAAATIGSNVVGTQKQIVGNTINAGQTVVAGSVDAGKKVVGGTVNTAQNIGKTSKAVVGGILDKPKNIFG